VEDQEFDESDSDSADGEEQNGCDAVATDEVSVETAAGPAVSL